jgi:hypothetical protein
VRESRPEEPGPPSEGLATFYPGTPNVGEARRVSIRPGDDRGGINFTLLITRAVRISGTVIDSMGRPVNEAPVELLDPTDGRIVGHPFGNFGLTHDGGRFTFLNVSPGSYLISAQVDAPATSYEERALVPVIATEGSSEVTVTTDPGTSITGTVATTSTVSLPRTWRGQVWARSGYGVTPPHRAALAASEPFVLGGVSGPTSFGVADLPTGWTLQRIEINGADVSDGTVDIRPRTPVTARIVVTNATAPLSGVVTADGQAVADVPVVAFVTEPTKWTIPSRFVKLTRTDADGRFRVTGLPAADYLVIASRELDDDDYLDAEWLLRLRNRATPVSITERSPATVTLTLEGSR